MLILASLVSITQGNRTMEGLDAGKTGDPRLPTAKEHQPGYIVYDAQDQSQLYRPWCEFFKKAGLGTK